MRRFVAVLAATLAALLALVAPAQAYDTDYLNQSRRMLQEAPLFVSAAAGMTGTADKDAAAAALAGTNVALVILPQAAVTGADDTVALAQQLAQSTNYSSIGVQAGSYFAVGSRTLSADQAATISQQVANQTSITDMATTLAKLAVPQKNPPATPDTEATTSGGSAFGTVAIILVALLLVSGTVVGGLLLRRRTIANSPASQLAVLLREVQQLASHMTSQSLRGVIQHIATDTNALLDRLAKYSDKSNKADLVRTQQAYVELLTSVKVSVERYVDASENPRYYPNEGRDAMAEISDGLNNLSGEVRKHAMMVTNREGSKKVYDALARMELFTPPERSLLQ